MVFWTADERSTPAHKSELAYISYLLWLNLADVNSTLKNTPGGITTVEALRFLVDWEELKKKLSDDRGLPVSINREEFKNWSLGISSSPQRTIRRITRILSTCYRREMDEIAPETDIKAIVAEELGALEGYRFERFCYCLARFCKFDYGLRFSIY